MRIYLDHNAGSPIRPEVGQALAEWISAGEGNPASVHRSGQRARRALERARESVGALIGADPRQIIFTSGGTESNNLAIFGGAAATGASRQKIITSAIEHSSILTPLLELERRGYQIVRVSPDRQGRISQSEVLSALDRDTALVTLGLANAEVGTVSNLAPLAEPIKEAGALFHIDAAQALGRIAVNPILLGADLLTVSGHKLGAPAGAGALYVRDPVTIVPTILGGPHEGGLRAGTPNLIGIVGFGAAAGVVTERLEEEAQRVGMLAQGLLALLHESIPGLQQNGPVSPEERIPNTLNLTFPRVLGESMLIALDLAGVEVSMGSACAAGAVEPSHVLSAMGLDSGQALSSLRISLGWSTTESEIEAAAAIIADVWGRVADSEELSAGAFA